MLKKKKERRKRKQIDGSSECKCIRPNIRLHYPGCRHRLRCNVFVGPSGSQTVNLNLVSHHFKHNLLLIELQPVPAVFTLVIAPRLHNGCSKLEKLSDYTSAYYCYR